MVFNGYIRIDHWNNKLFFLLTVWDLPMAGLHIVVLLTRITIFIFVATEMGWWNWLIWSLEICWCRQQGASVMAGMDQEFSPVGRTSRMPRMGHTFNGSLPAIMAFQAFHGWMDNMNGNGGDAVHGWQEANSESTTVVMLETIYRWLVREKVATMARSAIVGIATSSVWCSESGPLGYGSRDFNPDKVEDWLVQTLNHSFLVGGLDFFHFSIYWE